MFFHVFPMFFHVTEVTSPCCHCAHPSLGRPEPTGAAERLLPKGVETLPCGEPGPDRFFLEIFGILGYVMGLPSGYD
jgi:hypothetical protein